MRILLIDIDSLRADHLGCYGYPRATSPTIDDLAASGVRFERCYVSDAPCLPSRTAWASGRYGIHSGVVAHGGERAEPYNTSRDRIQAPATETFHWFQALERTGHRTASVSSFPARHAAWWYVAGLREWRNSSRSGMENADEVGRYAEAWLDENAESEDWVLHVNFWDAHTPYRAPESVRGAFEEDPPPPWLTEEILAQHRAGFGTLSARDPMRYWFPDALPFERPGVPGEIETLDDWKLWIDAYDEGIRFVDDHVAHLVETLDRHGVLDETVIVVTADHGENQGELNIYGDHQTADHPTCRVPMIVRDPAQPSGRIDRALHYQFDVGATLLELAGAEVPAAWDARSFAPAFRNGTDDGRVALVLSQMAWSCQRSVRVDNWLYIRTYHSGLKDLPREMLFDVECDPHQTEDRTDRDPSVVERARSILLQWLDDAMIDAEVTEDPMWTVIREGGPSLARGRLDDYLERLRATGRGHLAPRVRAATRPYDQ